MTVYRRWRAFAKDRFRPEADIRVAGKSLRAKRLSSAAPQSGLGWSDVLAGIVILVVLGINVIGDWNAISLGVNSAAPLGTPAFKKDPREEKGVDYGPSFDCQDAQVEHAIVIRVARS
jgi:hypothetical protein